MSCTVLVVDDDPDIRDVMRLALESRGYDVLTAADGVDCMRTLRALARGARPCVVLLDLMMPGMNGHAVCQALAGDAALSGLPVVILTGDTRASEDGPPVAELLRKPIDLATLVRVVEKHCGPPAAA